MSKGRKRRKDATSQMEDLNRLKLEATWKYLPTLAEPSLSIEPRLKRKRGVNPNLKVNPFPDLSKKYEGIFTGISVEVCDKEQICELYENGFYGKGSQSRSAPRAVRSKTVGGELVNEAGVTETLALELEEAFVLAYILECLTIKNFENRDIKWPEYYDRVREVNPKFLECLAAYLHLKSQQWVVKSGLKFGGQFLAYKKGPRFYHSSFLVMVHTPEDREALQQNDIQCLIRVSESSGKDVLFLEVRKPQDFILNNLSDLRQLTISEMILNRFMPTQALKELQEQQAKEKGRNREQQPSTSKKQGKASTAKSSTTK